MKREIIKNFEEEINFYPCGRHLLVHPSDINPCTYSIATLKGYGLREKDLERAFGRMIKRKLKERESTNTSWPLTKEELLKNSTVGFYPNCTMLYIILSMIGAKLMSLGTADRVTILLLKFGP